MKGENKMIERASTWVLILLAWILSIGNTACVFGHDPAAVYPSPSTANYQNSFIIFPHFAIGTSGNTNYTSILQITNTSREKQRKARLTIHGTGSTRFEADYTINGWDYSGSRVYDADIPPFSTLVLAFRSDSPLKSGFINLNPNSGAEKSDFATSFFFQLRNIQTGGLTDSVGVAPSDFGWHFVIPLTVSSKRGINTGIAYSHIPDSQRVQVVFELWHHTGQWLAIEDDVITWADNTWIEPYHKAQFVTQMFPDLFEGHEHWTRTFYGSLHIYAQRNINVLALRIDTEDNGEVELTSVPTSGELCIDGPNRMDNCFEEERNLTADWVPVRKKSKNELWAEAGGFCDAAGVCSP